MTLSQTPVSDALGLKLPEGKKKIYSLSDPAYVMHRGLFESRRFGRLKAEAAFFICQLLSFVLR